MPKGWVGMGVAPGGEVRQLPDEDWFTHKAFIENNFILLLFSALRYKFGGRLWKEG